MTHRPFVTTVDEEAARLAPTAAGGPSSYPAAGSAATTQMTGKKTWFGRNKMPDAAPATAAPLGSGVPAAAAGKPVGSAPARNGTGHAGWFDGQQQGNKVSWLGLSCLFLTCLADSCLVLNCSSHSIDESGFTWPTHKHPSTLCTCKLGTACTALLTTSTPRQ